MATDYRWIDYQNKFTSLREALKPVPLQKGRTFIPLQGREIQADVIGDFWWDLPERFVTRSYYPSFINLRYALYTFCLLVMDEDDFLYLTLRVSAHDCRVVARSRTWSEAKQAHAEYHNHIVSHPNDFGFRTEDLQRINVDPEHPLY